MTGEKSLLVFEDLFTRVRNGNRSAEATTENLRPVITRPSIGLVLGGGIARGFAHIGVLRVLIANGIVPDVVVGTSIGAVVGGCYAGGQIDALAEWACGLTTQKVFGYLDISLSGSGLISGNRLATRLEAVLGNTRIENLPTRFAAITTEIGTGHEIWLTRGRLVKALRASYALPGVFAPISLGGKWLVDGTLVNPVPVSVARAFGARLVIAVNLNADLFGRGSTVASHGSDENDDRLVQEIERKRSGMRDIFAVEYLLKRKFVGATGRPGISTVMVEAFNVMQDRITRSRLAGDPPDVLITPRLHNISSLDFHRGTEAIEIGAETTEKSIDSISEAITALSQPYGANDVAK
ncbi:MAG TPA: patatin-like phospholipase family protein [Pseudolabrys sp.]|jgi:NTE family protein